MDFLKSEIKNIIIFVALLIGVFMAYMYFKENAPTNVGSGLLETAVLPQDAAASQSGDTQGGDIGSKPAIILDQISNIQFDTRILKSPLYMRLVEKSGSYDFSIPSASTGRDNPFQPVSRGSSAPAIVETPAPKTTTSSASPSSSSGSISLPSAIRTYTNPVLPPSGTSSR